MKLSFLWAPRSFPLRWLTVFILTWCAFASPAGAQEPPVIDVMVVYTDAVSSYHGGEAGVRAHVLSLMGGANLGLQESGIDAAFRLAYTGKVDYVESDESLNEDLGRMWNKVGAFAGVATMRDEIGADLVCLLRSGAAGGAAGVAYVLKQASGRDDVAFSVVTTQFASSTFLHELGHNLGAGHARDDTFNGVPTTGGLDVWSNGYRFTGSDGEQYRTIMAYAPGRRLMQFSSPGLTFQGVAAGRPASAPDSADNARTLRATFPLVEDYRERPLQSPVIASQPNDQIIHLGESAIFRVGVAGTADARYQWYEGESGDTSLPIDGAISPVLAVNARIADALFWVRVINDAGHVDSRAAALHVAAGFPPRLDQGVEPTDLIFTGGVKWQEFVPEFDYLDYIMLPLNAWGAPTFDVVVAVTTSDGLELARRSLSRHAVAGEEWDRVSVGVQLDPGDTYKIMVDLGTRGVDDYFGLRARPGPIPLPDGSENLADAEFGFRTYGSSDDWFTIIDPASRSVGDYRESYGITVTSNTEWTVTEALAWLTATRSGGAGTNGMVNIEFAPYDEASGDFGPRSGHVIIGDQVHQVTQAAITPTVSFGEANKTMPAAGGEYVLAVTSNFRWIARLGPARWAILEGAICCEGDELHVTGEGDTMLRITVEPNTGTEDRSTVLTIFDTVHVLTQEGVSEAEPEVPTGEFPGTLKMGAAAFARYEGIGGGDLSDLHAAATFPDAPDSVEEFPSFELQGGGENFGVHAWAWLVPETTGDYTFWIASDDEGVLSLSPSADSSQAAIIARVSSHTESRQYDRFSEQESAPVRLEAGKAYYIEARMKQGWSDVNLSVAWRGPGFAREVIPGRVLGLPDPNGDPTGPIEITGTASLARYDSITGKTLDHLYNSDKFPDSPDAIVDLTRFSYLGNGSNFGLFAWAWLVPTESGNYTFWLSSDDNGELLLSSNADPANAVRVANVPGHSGFEQFDKFPEQQSSTVALEAGKAYYIAAAAKQEWGGAHLSVAWQGPGFGRRIIPGEVLTTAASSAADGEVFGSGTWETGAMAIARYDGVMGSKLGTLRASPAFPEQPDVVGTMEQFDYSGTGYNFGLYAWGWLIPEVTGAYRFWLASDDQGELRLSPNAEPGDAVTIASVETHTNPYQYEKMPSQRSDEVILEAGEIYYIEALAQQGWGGVNLSVAWQGPGFDRETIPGRVLALRAGENSP